MINSDLSSPPKHAHRARFRAWLFCTAPGRAAKPTRGCALHGQVRFRNMPRGEENYAHFRQGSELGKQKTKAMVFFKAFS